MTGIDDDDTDRRVHPRVSGPHFYLLVDGQPARLVDWSFGGLGVRMEFGTGDLAPGSRVSLLILRNDGETWTTLRSIVRRVEPGENAVGVELEDAADGFPVMMELFHHKLAEIQLPA